MKRDCMCRWSGLILSLLLAWAPAQAQAGTRAWLDRVEVAVGEPVTLKVETDQSAAAPDFSALAADFEVGAQSSSRRLSMSNGSVRNTVTYSLVLVPRRAGILAIPALRVGAERTEPMSLAVGRSAAAPAARGDASTFLETDVDDPTPYVQQSVGVTVRLFYSAPLASGQLDLAAPEGASLQQVGRDVQTSRQVNGRSYSVVERRFLLVADHSGPLVIPGPRFVGRGAGGWMDDFFGGNSREMQATGAPRTLDVRPQPGGAPQPWLPLRDLRLRYVAAPQSARAGEAVAFVVEAIASGATQAQLPELPVPSVTGAQVFAEPAQLDESFNGGTPQLKVTRRYSVVPNGAGVLSVPGIQLAWWDVRAGAARNASLPALKLKVAPGAGGFAGNTLPAPADAERGTGAGTTTTAGGADAMPWKWLALGFGALWLLTLAWFASRRGGAQPARMQAAPATDAAVALPTHTAADLRRALDSGTLDDVADVLRGMSTPPLPDLDALVAALDSPAQRQAIEQLRRVRWAGGDGVAARAVLREAFAGGPAWRLARPPVVEKLPPLYPR
ncbi:MAG: protein BatD [Lysobacteraceae bacterium]|nr:MAG: protein BatD [Xanthomonadaceae bacterium]